MFSRIILLSLIVLCVRLDGATAYVPPRKAALEFGMPRARTTPTIDGHIEDGEWDDALVVNALCGQSHGELYLRDAMWYAKWDEETLYLACRSNVREGERLRREHRGRIGDAQADDSVEFFVDPHGRDASRFGPSTFYQFVINAAGCGSYRAHKEGAAAPDRSWQPDVKIGNGFTDDRKWWDFEAAIPNESISAERPTLVGKTWGLNLARNFKVPGARCALPMRSPQWAAPEFFGHYRSEQDRPFVRLLSLEGLHNLRAYTRLELVNPSTDDVKLNVAVTIRAGGTDLFATTRQFALKAGKRVRWTLDEPLPQHAPKTNLLYNLAVAVVGQRQPVAFLTCRFHEATEAEKQDVLRSFEGDPLEPASQIAYNPLRSNLLLAVDLIDMPTDILEDACCQWRVRREGSAALVAEGEFDTAFHQWMMDVVELPELEAGGYQAELAFVDAEGRARHRTARTFRKLDEEAEFPWWNTRAGDPNQLLPPFTPVSFDGKAAVCWGRTYYLDGLGLPQRIDSQDMDVLGGRCELKLTVNGEEERVRGRSKLTMTRLKDWQADFEGAVDAGPVRLSTKTRLEQDGAYFIDLTYAPLGEDPVVIDDFILELPLRKTAECMCACSDAGRYTTMIGEDVGPVWNSTTGVGKAMTLGSFVPSIWVGDERNGLFWFADNDKGWEPRDDVPACEIVRTTRGLVLRLNFVKKGEDGQGLELTGPRTISFALMATPAVPYRADWRVGAGGSWGARDPRLMQATTRGESERYDPEDPACAWSWYHPGMRDSVNWDLCFETMRGEEQWQKKHITVPSEGQGLNTGLVKELEYFAAEWGSNSYTQTLIDHYVWCFDQHLRKGDLRYLHLDLSRARCTYELSNGRAYRLPDGRIQPGYHLFGRRELHKRLYACFVESNKRPWLASTGQGLLPTSAFLTSYMTEADGLTLVGESEGDEEVFSRFLRAYAVPMIMGGVKRPFYEHGKAPAVAALLYLHNIFSWQAGPGSTLLAEWGIYEHGDEEVFYPFWRNEKVLEISGREVKCSLLKQGSKVLLVAANFDPRQTQTTGFTVDLRGMGFEDETPMKAVSLRPPRSTAKFDTSRKNRIAIEGVRIPPRDYVLISIEPLHGPAR